jgi:hypothetical protein
MIWRRSSEEHQKPKAALIGIIVILLGFIVLWTECRTYLRSYMWHIRRGNQVEIYGHRLVLPLDWWNEVATQNLSLITRAWIPHRSIGAGIIVRPIQTNEVFHTDADLARAQELQIKNFNLANRKGGRDTSASRTMSALILNTKLFPLYCTREDFMSLEITITCGASGFPYELKYEGPPDREQEGTQILSSMQ